MYQLEQLAFFCTEALINYMKFEDADDIEQLALMTGNDYLRYCTLKIRVLRKPLSLKIRENWAMLLQILRRWFLGEVREGSEERMDAINEG